MVMSSARLTGGTRVFQRTFQLDREGMLVLSLSRMKHPFQYTRFAHLWYIAKFVIQKIG
jgi:hypothetical protein